MKNAQIRNCTLLALMFFARLAVVEAQDSAPSTVCIPNTEVKSILSKIVKDMVYQIHVTVPENYDPAGDPYPVLYYVDAWAESSMLIGIYQMLRFTQEVKPMILVGISHGGREFNWHRYRSRDLTPSFISHDSAYAFGGAENFFGFIKTELIPLIESSYKVDPTERTFFGHSHGGLFGSWVLFNHPGVFQNYFIGSPSLWWDNYFVLKEENEIIKKLRKTKANVFVTVGGEEPQNFLDSMQKMTDMIRKNTIQNVRFQSKIIAGETHVSVLPGSYAQAFRILCAGKF